MMLLFLLPLLVSAAPSSKHLIDNFECGSDTNPFSYMAAKFSLRDCSDAVWDGTNLCCKLHDRCYDVHAAHNFTREYCDERFCACLKDVSDKNKDYACSGKLEGFCDVAKNHGGEAFDQANTGEPFDKLAGFIDYSPLELNMQALVNACPHSKGIAVHCHDSVVRCLEKPHERDRRDIVEHYWQDCRSTMHDCLQMIVEDGATEQCGTIARAYAKQANTYIDLQKEKHGKAVIETYPVIGARLLKKCSQSTNALESCFSSFDSCAEQNQKENPELLNAAMRINAQCHNELRDCINTATQTETSEDCAEARALAVNRIRGGKAQEEAPSRPNLFGVFGSIFGGGRRND